MDPKAIVRWAHARIMHRTSAVGDRGAGLVEYALLVGLIAVVCVLAVTYFGAETSDSFSRTASEMKG